MTRLLVALAVLAAALSLVGVASADPSHNVLPEFMVTCSDGQSLTVLPGTFPNNSSIGFVRDSTSIFVAKSFIGTLDGEPVFGFESRGLKGFSDKDLITCTGLWTIEGVTFGVTVTGFVTPAQL